MGLFDALLGRRKVAGPAPDRLFALSTAYVDLEAYLNTTTTWSLDTDVDILNTATGQLQATVSVSSANGAGNESGTLVPQAAQALLRWSTGEVVNGRFVRGRTFIPGLNTSSIDGGEVASAVRSGIVTQMTQMISDANSELVVWSRTNGVAVPVTAVSVWDEWAILRGRRY